MNVQRRNVFRFRDKIISRCRLSCRPVGHYHCHLCKRTVIRRVDMERHLLLCDISAVTKPPSNAPSTVLIPSPAAPFPVIPSPAAPSPVIPSPAAPSTVIPSPAAPSSVIPSPAAPSTVIPSPAAPSPVIPSPSAPSTVIPLPTAPSPVLIPSPAAPSPVLIPSPSTVISSPSAPSTVIPSPTAPAPVLTPSPAAPSPVLIPSPAAPSTVLIPSPATPSPVLIPSPAAPSTVLIPSPAAPSPVLIPSPAAPSPVIPSPTAPSPVLIPSPAAPSPVLIPSPAAPSPVLIPSPAAPSPVLIPSPAAPSPVLIPSPSAPSPVLIPSPSAPSPVLIPSPSAPSPVLIPSPAAPSPVLIPSPSAPSPVLIPSPAAPSPVLIPSPAAPSPVISSPAAPSPVLISSPSEHSPVSIPPSTAPSLVLILQPATSSPILTPPFTVPSKMLILPSTAPSPVLIPPSITPSNLLIPSSAASSTVLISSPSAPSPVPIPPPSAPSPVPIPPPSAPSPVLISSPSAPSPVIPSPSAPSPVLIPPPSAPSPVLIPPPSAPSPVLIPPPSAPSPVSILQSSTFAEEHDYALQSLPPAVTLNAQSIKCPQCGLNLLRKNLRVHISRRHAEASPGTTQARKARGMKLRIRVGKRNGRLELQADEVTLGDLRRKLSQMYLPTLGFSPDTSFSITLNGRDPLTEDESSLESFGVISGDLIVVVTADTLQPAPTQEPPLPPSSSETSDTDCAPGARDVAEPGPSCSQEASAREEAAMEEEEAPFCPPGPMLCSEAADGKIPHSLEALYLSSSCATANDALVVVAHLLMVETGYTVQGAKNKATPMPEGWRSSAGIYKLHYSHPLCGDSSAALVCVPMGKLLIINATLTIGAELKCVKRLQLTTGSYISFPQQDVALVYRDLQKLSRLFKDQLVYPLLAATRQALDLPDVFGLVVLPPELKLRIFRLLDARSVLSLGSTCKNLRADTEDPSLWRFLYMRDFRDDSVRDPHTDWKELYKEKYKRTCRNSRSRYRPYVPDFPPFHPDPFPPDQYPPNFPYPPGIIGGEYDQNPIFPFARDPLSLLDPRRHPKPPGLFQPARPRFDPLFPGRYIPPQSRGGPFL
ncbi:F-box only protein 7 [Hyla sarda]|uniref:F-box only protein 7 n=1 Tax=Hyla sarda TaxID=327740 RepID=UPI0024C2655F|nr:F-box only protein 7 [Hyla sarda]